MAPSVFPPNPSLEQLKKQAKDLLKAHKSARPDVVVRLKENLPHFSGLSDRAVLQTKFALKDAQHVIAREHGFADWPVLKEALADKTQYFADYQWSRGEPQGVAPIEDPTGIAHFRLLETDGGVRVEQFDKTGKFVRLVYCPQDRKITYATYKTSADHLHRVRRSENGAVRFYEEYEWPDGVYSDDVYPVVRVFNEHGRLIAQHRPKQVSESAWDIHVFDALGKRRVVLHHTDIGESEPCTIDEEWME